MKITKIEYPKPVTEYFAIRATANLKAMKKEFKEITGNNLRDCVLIHNGGPIHYFYSRSEDIIEAYLYEYLIIIKTTGYSYGKLRTTWDYRLMTIEEFNVTFKEIIDGE